MIPIGLGAGVYKKPEQLSNDFLACAAESATMGSDTLLARKGNPDPTYYFDEKTGNSYNAVGLRGEGTKITAQWLPDVKGRLYGANKRLRQSLAPTKPGDMREMLNQLAIMPFRTLVDQYEFNAACPNHRDGEKLHDVLVCDPIALRELLEETKGFGLKREQRALKIAPDTEEDMLRRIFDLCEEFDIGAIVSSNTRRVSTPVVDGKAMISVAFCGQAGTALLEPGIAQMKLLAKIREEYRSKMRLIGCGGISQGGHARRYEEAGADELQIVTGYLQYGPRVFEEILVGM
jgi:dihydroorotate dehydrogenase